MGTKIEQFCPQALFTGSCTIPDCSLSHRGKFCDLCSVVCPSIKSWKPHVNGRSHKRRAAAGIAALVLCPICDIRLSGLSPAVHPRDPNHPGAIYCLVCRRAIHAEAWSIHVTSGKHQKAQRNALYRAQIEGAAQDRGGVSVSDEAGIDFGIVSRTDSRKGLQKQLTVTLNVSSAALGITRLETFAGSGNKPSAFTASISDGVQRITATRPARIDVRFRSQNRGRFDGRLEITFQDTTTRRTFVIIRQLRATVGNAADHDLLRPAAPYVRRGRAPWQKEAEVLEGERPPAMEAVRWVKMLPPSTIPAALATLLGDGATRDVINQVKSRHLPATLKNESHGQYFRVLLWLEEYRMAEDLRMYDIEGARFTKEGRLYTLPVPGLSEKRPSVVPGDTISAQIGNDGRTHRGYVHQVRRDDIGVAFHSSFKVTASYNVQFKYNRTPIKRQHQALLASSTSSLRLLFPSPGHEGVTQAIGATQYPLTLFNALIEKNALQLQAVKTILRLRSGSAPFVVFGPPGTGKTVTVVEAMLQILRTQPNARILACAPSNSAADLIAQRLNSLSTSELFRCNAFFRDRLGLPEDLAAYSLYRNGHFSLPSVETLKTYKVVVTTCGNASFAYNIGMPNGHFTHIFIDEAGQAAEPEALTAIKAVASTNTRVVLSGDPMQLGPVIRSSIARELGLGKSYLERLMERAVYDPQTGRGRSYIKLVKNFRSHKAILDYPNERFYNDELEVCGPPATINSLLGSPMLVNAQWPVVFHYISGENERESTSPSYFNIDEATEAVDYVKELLKDRRHPIRAADIGIITPYYAQVRKIRLLLRKEKIEDVKVGSVEEFQGQERRVIIVSTVRSTRDLLSYDAKFTLGFVSNPRRFNVAVTRAQALLVVIGDASVLSIDPLWRAFMNYVHLHGGWRGDAPEWDTSAEVDMHANYAVEMRDAAAADMDALMERLGHGDDVEGEANVDHGFQEVE